MPKQDIHKIRDWQIENTDRIEIKPNKRLHITERIQIAIDNGYPGKRQTYIIEAINEKLNRDGITLDTYSDE